MKLHGPDRSKSRRDKSVTKPVAIAVCLLTLGSAVSLSAQDIGDLKKGVVKIIAKVDDKTRVGAGVIVKLEKDAAYIVTASHVIEGEQHPHVMFFSDPHRPIKAKVLGLEGGDPRGLAALRVEGALPDDLRALVLDQTATVNGGESVMLIGFPLAEGTDWTITVGTISGRKGSSLSFAGIADEGNSGGPVLLQGRVIGIVTQVGQKFNYATPSMTARFAIEGWGVRLTEKMAQDEKNDTEPPRGTALESRKMDPDRQITGKDGAPMVLIPAGEFRMGSADEEVKTVYENCQNIWKENPGIGLLSKEVVEGFLETCKARFEAELPRHRIYLDAYYMDKFEVTVARYAAFFHSTIRTLPLYWQVLTTEKHGNLPVIGVDWHDADAYCRWAGKRLPTEAEWEKAARATDGQTYPWGNDTPTSRQANFGKGQGQSAVYWGGLAPVDSHEPGKSPYGLYHMAGNAWEWTADWYDEQYYEKSPKRNPRGPSNGTVKVLRGGSFSSQPDQVRSANRFWTAPSDRDQVIGFRCAQDAPH